MFSKIPCKESHIEACASETTENLLHIGIWTDIEEYFILPQEDCKNSASNLAKVKTNEISELKWKRERLEAHAHLRKIHKL